MEAPRTSLNVHLPWPQTADLLGLGRADAALPARTACPLCHHRRLQVYEDGLCGGAWFACPDCGRSGDLIELAAAALPFLKSATALGLPAIALRTISTKALLSTALIPSWAMASLAEPPVSSMRA